MNDAPDKALYEKVLKDIKKQYKPRLKNLSKNELIDIVVELSAHSAVMKQLIDDFKSKKEENE